VTCANHIVMNVLSQDPDFKETDGALEGVMSKIITTEMDEVHRYSMESDAKSLLMQLGIEDLHQPIGELSGGQKKRLALAATVLKPCDVLILDEPTNHLDYDMIEWLEDFLRNWKKALIMVTHDRYFLDSVCNRIVEIDRGAIYSYDTNYTGYLERKAAREESLRATERKRQSILRKEIEWMQRGARARSTKQKAHIQRYEALRDQKAPELTEKVEMASLSSRLGRTTIELEGVSKAFGDLVCVKDFSYVLVKNDRIGFVGKNGCGKTTLMKMIAGLMEPDSGHVEIGQTVKVGYYSQEIAFLRPEERVIDYIKDTAEYVRTEDGLVSATAMLERFLFPSHQQYSPIGKLSGGEKRRLSLLKVLMEAPNVLVLDEPTNDLDTETLAILEDYLDNFQGIVITVSHDRYFLDRIVRRIFAFEGDGKIVQYEGGYTDYMAKRPEPVDGLSAVKNAAPAAPKQDSKATWGHQQKLKFTFKEQKEYETIESDIEKLETKIASLEDEILKNATNYGKLNALTIQKDELETQLMEKMERWEYLEDLAQRIANQS
ncbi:MAG: ABC-F family ATP-binding cassette domain-containing protein, partial [Agathobacter sp.]|nr:ABC-F family ATP-binding cassette domain-containing protein [Agathobacter sp.]